jgi:hypothetical protein
MNWSPGDKALFLLYEPGEGTTPLKRYANTVVTIESHPIVSPSYVSGIGHYVRFHTGLVWDVGAVCLHPLPPKNDRFEAGEWDLCPWRPTEIEVTS